MILAQSVDFSPRKLGGPTRAAHPNAPRLRPLKQQTPAEEYLAEAEERRDKAYDSWQHLEAPEKGFYYRVYLANVGWVEDCRTALKRAGRGL